MSAGPLLRLRRLPGADPDVPLPAYASTGAAGADLRANLGPAQRGTGLVLAPGARALVPTGLAMEIPAGFEVQIRPRSGLARDHGIALVNAPGTVDSDYRGEIGVLLINLGAEAFTVLHGTRIAQIVVAPVAVARFELAQALSETGRGAGGFGSTGTG